MGHGEGHEIGVHKVAHLAGLTFNMDTLYMTWLAMGIVVVLAVLATRKLQIVPRGLQNALEIVVEALMTQIETTVGAKNAPKIASLLITLFLFLLVGNELGLVPGLTSPTNDLNTTLGLAVMVLGFVHVLGVREQGMKYIKHFFEPYKVFVFINIIEELSKPITLSFRLFGNILAGEILIIILGMLVPIWFPVPSVVWLAFSVFVGVVQAFIFTILSLSYLSNALKDHH